MSSKKTPNEDEVPQGPPRDSRALIERATVVLLRNAAVRVESSRTQESSREVGSRFMQLRHGMTGDRQFRLAALNLMEDAQVARRNEEVETRQRVRAEAEARDSAERYRQLFESMNEGFAILDILDGGSAPMRGAMLVECNPAFERLLHVHDCAGRSLGEVVPEAAPDWLRQFERVRHTGEPATFEAHLPRLDTWLYVSVSRIGVDGSDRLAAVVSDITRRKVAESALQHALEETERARADTEAAGQAKDHFLAVLSHELRTPLTPALLAAEMLLERDDLLPDVEEAIAMIRRNVEVEAHFVDDLLDVTRIARGRMALTRAPIELHDSIARAIEVTAGDFKARRLRPTVDLAAGHTRLEGDATRLQQAFWNLLKNAAKFTPPGGEVAIRTRNRGETIVVEVSDTGVGIEAGHLETIFDPFVQGGDGIARDFGGLGLGLAIAQAIVRGHGGTLAAHSDGPGRGSTFTMSLPLGPGPSP